MPSRKSDARIRRGRLGDAIGGAIERLSASAGVVLEDLRSGFDANPESWHQRLRVLPARLRTTDRTIGPRHRLCRRHLQRRGVTLTSARRIGKRQLDHRLQRSARHGGCGAVVLARALAGHGIVLHGLHARRSGGGATQIRNGQQRRQPGATALLRRRSSASRCAIPRVPHHRAIVQPDRTGVSGRRTRARRYAWQEPSPAQRSTRLSNSWKLTGLVK